MRVNETRKPNPKKNQKNSSGLKSRKIPKSKLMHALEVLKDPENNVWKDRNIACETQIHNHRHACAYNHETSDIFNMELRLRYAQTCLLRRDWNSLAKIILLYKPDKSNEHLLRLFAKYASICLAYTNQPLLESFLQSFNCTDPVGDVLKNWTSLSNTE